MLLTNQLVLGTGLEPAFTDLKGRLPKDQLVDPSICLKNVDGNWALPYFSYAPAFRKLVTV